MADIIVAFAFAFDLLPCLIFFTLCCFALHARLLCHYARFSLLFIFRYATLLSLKIFYAREEIAIVTYADVDGFDAYYFAFACRHLCDYAMRTWRFHALIIAAADIISAPVCRC